MNPKSIYISYTDKDISIANRIRDLLGAWFGTTDPIYMRTFDTKPGTNKFLELDETLDETHWFILVYTESAAQDDWMQLELSTQAFKLFEKSGYEIVIFRTHNSQYPKHLATYLNHRPTFDATQDVDTAVMRVADYIENSQPTLADKSDTYTNRGGDRDRFWAEVARRHKISFVWGWSGIGKTQFVEISAKEKLKKKPLRVRLTRGHSIDRLCRDVIDVCKEKRQPFNENITDEVLLYEAMNALRKRSGSFFLFLDDAESALDSGNTLHTYLERFLLQYLDANIETWVVLATTRSPDISDDIISRNAKIFKLGTLHEDDIEESVERWLAGNPELLAEAKSSIEHWDKLIALIDGYPLAINFVSLALLGGKKPSDIINDNGRQTLQRRAARSILRSFNNDVLTEVHQHLLFALSVIDHPATIDDLRSIMSIRARPLMELQLRREELLSWRLVESYLDRGSFRELMTVHKFIRSYFWDELQKDSKRYETIAREYGKYALQRCLDLYQQLQKLMDESELDDPRVEWLSNEVFRYAIPGDRLLRSINRDDLADEIPYQLRFRGTLRELVFFFYEEANDYEKALDYAEKWLTINPNDYRVKLFQARCYRNFRDSKSLEKATQIVGELERMGRTRKRQQRAELYRERALIADFSGDENLAINYFMEGIRVDKSASYTENYTGIAKIYVRQADRLSEGISERTEKVREALDFLNYAREQDIKTKRYVFDSFHLGTYAEALILNGEEEVAFPLLERALVNRPNDYRVQYWLAEIHRKRGELEISEKYAKEALKGETKATMTLANIYRTRAQKARNESEKIRLLELALTQAEEFHPEYGSGNDVKATIKSQILRDLGRLPEALHIMEEVSGSQNPQTINEYCTVLKYLALQIENQEKNPAKALELIRDALLAAEKLRDNPFIDRNALLINLHSEETRLDKLVR